MAPQQLISMTKLKTHGKVTCLEAKLGNGLDQVTIRSITIDENPSEAPDLDVCNEEMAYAKACTLQIRAALGGIHDFTHGGKIFYIYSNYNFDLEDLKKYRPNRDVTYGILRGIFLAVEQLHWEAKIAHGGLSDPRNIVILKDTDGKYNVKLQGFREAIPGKPFETSRRQDCDDLNTTLQTHLGLDPWHHFLWLQLRHGLSRSLSDWIMFLRPEAALNYLTVAHKWTHELGKGSELTKQLSNILEHDWTVAAKGDGDLQPLYDYGKGKYSYNGTAMSFLRFCRNASEHYIKKLDGSIQSPQIQLEKLKVLWPGFFYVLHYALTVCGICPFGFHSKKGTPEQQHISMFMSS